MFALEINFQDGVSQPEMLLVRRPQAILGSSDYAHVVIESSGSLAYELRLSRGIGRQFSCQKFGRAGTQAMSQMLSEGMYEGDAEVDLGEVSTTITSLDVDLLLRQGESPDLAGVRVLRRALTVSSPRFPAVVIAGPSPVFVSFNADTPLLIGRSRKCGLRLDASDVSAEHARIGIEGQSFWIEDLGSTNGTFVKGERVVGRRTLQKGEAVQIGSEYKIHALNSEDEVSRYTSQNRELAFAATLPATHPCLVASSEDLAPPRLVIAPGSRILIGRDPASDMWTGAGHVSGRHSELVCDAQGVVALIDHSRNGTSLNGVRLQPGQVKTIIEGRNTIDLGAGLSVQLFLSKEDESASASTLERNRESKSPVARALERRDGAPEDYSNLETQAFSSNGGSGAIERSAEAPAGKLGVFEQLARRAGIEQSSTNRPPTRAEDILAGSSFEEENPVVMTRFSRALLGVAIVILSVVLLLLVGWLLGNGSLFNS